MKDITRITVTVTQMIMCSALFCTCSPNENVTNSKSKIATPDGEEQGSYRELGESLHENAQTAIIGYVFTNNDATYITNAPFTIEDLGRLLEGMYFPPAEKTAQIERCPFQVVPNGFQTHSVVEGTVYSSEGHPLYNWIIKNIQSVKYIDSKLYPEEKREGSETTDPFK